jgi:hypothetical protein
MTVQGVSHLTFVVRDLERMSRFLCEGNFRASTFLLSLGLLRLGGYAFLGKRYWFSVPFRGILLAAIFYIIALIISRA